MEPLEQRIQRLVREQVEIEPYNPQWPVWFQLERQHLLRCLPERLVERIEHMVESDYAEHWDRLLFRDYLIGHPEVAAQYQALKIDLAASFPRDRVGYSQQKRAFIDRVTALAKLAL